MFEALDWPQDLDEYEGYLKRFIRWVPRQSDAQAWKDLAPEERYAKEVSDRLAHLFWLIDQKVGEGETAIAENSDVFRDWLTEFARQWGSFLNTTESFSQEILNSFLDYAPEYAVGDSMVDGVPNMPSGWLTFNQFFARELNTGLRPVTDPTSNLVITSPAGCSFQHSYDPDAESNIPATTVKHTHTYGNVTQLIEGSAYIKTFAAGAVRPSIPWRCSGPAAPRRCATVTLKGHSSFVLSTGCVTTVTAIAGPTTWKMVDVHEDLVTAAPSRVCRRRHRGPQRLRAGQRGRSRVAT